MSDVYGAPGKYGLRTIGEIDWSSGCYEFSLTVVWQNNFNGRFFYAEDSGCSCPSPFENTGIEDLVPIGALAEFQAHLAECNAFACEGSRDTKIAELLERMHAAGAR